MILRPVRYLLFFLLLPVRHLSGMFFSLLAGFGMITLLATAGHALMGNGATAEFYPKFIAIGAGFVVGGCLSAVLLDELLLMIYPQVGDKESLRMRYLPRELFKRGRSGSDGDDWDYEIAAAHDEDSR
ncbi:hypothetical protein [Pelagibius sp. Alg239-R121]|uniref:hypothetical protein n=1 Tax=Pelagibius sp. Alg239-R121 TaxID=2993448 RepID=UPI0024A70367|nr:hypothetical protein [Pelagibius sp. Alg239-R121]